MESRDILERATRWASGRGWRRKLAKRRQYEQSLFEHSLIELDVLLALLPVLAHRRHYGLDDTERKVLVVAVLAHDVGKETDEWQAYKVFRLRGLDQRYGARLVNYADDFVVLCRSGAAEVLAQSRRWFTQMGLTLNEQKTRVCHGRRETFVFLGDTFGPMRSRKNGHRYMGATPAKKAVQRVKEHIRQILRPGNQAPWVEVREELNRGLRGWGNYFSYGTRAQAYRAVDRYVTECVRRFLRRRHKVPSRGTRRYPAATIFGELGVVQLQRLHIGRPAHASV